MKKRNKRTRVLNYIHANPEATVKDVAIKIGTTYGYAYKILKSEEGKAEIALAKAAKAKKAEVKTAKEAKTAEFHAKKEQRITRADLVKELAPGLNDLFGFAKEFEAGRVSDGSTAMYYVLPKDANELQDLISHKNMNAQIGEIFRSCYRYGEVSHSDMLRDAKKIKFYAEAEIKRLEKLQ